MVPRPAGQVAQLVEQRTENPCVAGSIPALATNFARNARKIGQAVFLADSGYARCATSTTFEPPKAKEFDITARGGSMRSALSAT